MNVISEIIKEFFGLFVDDGFLALLSLLLIGGDAAAVKFAGLSPLVGALALLAGCLAILGVSVYRAARVR